MITRVVLDASAAIEAVLPGPRAAQVLDLLEGCPLVLAPALYCSEVANTLWKYVRAGDLDPAEAVTLLETALGLADRAVSDQELAHEALAEAISSGHPVYDLLYVTLSRRFGCTLITLDRRLAGLAEGLGVPCWHPGAAK